MPPIHQLRGLLIAPHSSSTAPLKPADGRSRFRLSAAFFCATRGPRASYLRPPHPFLQPHSDCPSYRCPYPRRLPCSTIGHPAALSSDPLSTPIILCCLQALLSPLTNFTCISTFARRPPRRRPLVSPQTASSCPPRLSRAMWHPESSTDRDASDYHGYHFQIERRDQDFWHRGDWQHERDDQVPYWHRRQDSWSTRATMATPSTPTPSPPADAPAAPLPLALLDDTPAPLTPRTHTAAVHLSPSPTNSTPPPPPSYWQRTRVSPST